jgi:hypothetical protein
VAERVGTFPWCQVVDEAAEGVSQHVDGSDGRARNRAFSLAKAILDRAQIRTIRGNENQACANRFDRLAHAATRYERRLSIMTTPPDRASGQGTSRR